MEKDLSDLKKEIETPLKDMEIIVDSVSFEVEEKLKFLRIVLDRVNGIDLETIVEATNIINPIVDKYDLMDDSYILDIVSKEKGE